MADRPAVFDQPVAAVGPVFRWEQGGDIAFHFHRVLFLAPAQAPRQPTHMRVHRNPGHAEGVAKHHVGGFTAHSRQLDEFFQRLGDDAVVLEGESLPQAEEVPGLGAEESQRPQHGFEFTARRSGESLWGGPAAEQFRGDAVDAGVGGLSGQHGGDQEFEGGVVVQGAVRVGVQLGEQSVDFERFFSALFTGQARFI